jgi:endonuclease YncB( thermonuclease family)
VIDGRTFALDDGSEVRLAALEVAPMPAAIAAGARADPAALAASPRVHAGLAAREALAGLAYGREVVLKQQAGSAADRYGRLVAFAFVMQDGAERGLQNELLAQGHARLAARIEAPGCLPALRTSEKAARAARLGLWADPDYAAQPADRPAEILARRGRFSVVEGEVVSVRDVAGTIYVNFGRRWSESFTAVVLKRNVAGLIAAGIDPQRLRGRRVEVRGYVEERGGPRIEVARPEQIAVMTGR